MYIYIVECTHQYDSVYRHEEINTHVHTSKRMVVKRYVMLNFDAITHKRERVKSAKEDIK